MKKTVVIFLLLALLLSACGRMESIDIHKMDLEQLMMRNEGEILKFNRKYSIDNLKDIEAYKEIDYCGYLYHLTGYNIGYAITSSTDAIESGAYDLSTDDVNKKRTLESFNSMAPIVCIRKVSQELLYTVHYNQGDYIYGFFKYDDDEKCWISTNEIYESCKKLNKADFELISVGNTLEDVLEIDPSQKRAFRFKRVYEKEFTSHHILKDGLLTITYEGEVDNKTQPADITVKSMEWSELPILEQDLPKQK